MIFFHFDAVVAIASAGVGVVYDVSAGCYYCRGDCDVESDEYVGGGDGSCGVVGEIGPDDCCGDVVGGDGHCWCC